MGRTNSKINDLQRRMNQVEMLLPKIEKDLKNHKQQIELVTDNQIIQMLQEKSSPYSNRPRYSYEEISVKTARSTGYISKLARENGLSRRSLKTV